MKKGKYIDYNILLACLSKKPQTTVQQGDFSPVSKDIVEEFYEALATPLVTKSAGLPGWRLVEKSKPLCCN